MTSSILRSVLCLTLLACAAAESAPDPEGLAAEEEVSSVEEEIIYGDNLYWYCENAGPELCVIVPAWLPRNECVLACQAVGITTPRCVLRWDPACAF